MNHKNTATGALMVAFSALLFACKGTLIKYIYTLGASVADLMVLRLLFSVPVYVWFAARHWPSKTAMPTRTQWLGVIASGISGYYIASYFDMLGLRTVSVGLERVTLYTYPAFVVIFSSWLFKRPLSPRLIFFIALSYVGLFMVFFADIRLQPTATMTATLTGSLCVVVSAITYAWYVVGGERYMRVMSSALFTSISMLSACIVMVLHYIALQSPQRLLTLSTPAYAWCVLLALVFTVLPAFLMSAGIQRIGSAKAAGVGMVGPVATLVIAALVLGETVTVLQIAGFAIVVFAIHRLHKA